MLRTLTVLSTIGLLAVAAPASAQDIRVSLTGKDPDTIRTDIKKAAYKVCAQALGEDTYHLLPEMAACLASTVEDAYAQIQDSSLVAELKSGGPATRTPFVAIASR